MFSFDWVKAAKLRKSFEGVVSGQIPAQEDAIKLLELLDGGSSLNLGELWASTDPIGVVDYYMAKLNYNDALNYFLNISETTGEHERVHAIIGVDGCIHMLVDPLTTVAVHKAPDSHKSIAIAYVNGGYLEKKRGGFVCGDEKYKMKSEVPPQKVEDDWWDPFESTMIVSSILLKRLLIAAIPTLDISNFVDYGKIEFKNSGKRSPLWPFKAISTLAFNCKNINDIKSLNCSELSLNQVKQFDVEASRLV